ncbi:kinase [Thraustotheca clavata]|uniref:Kinase n=1 Tax=Thraustotheca clavata TaxID=74557 RepID=A0A1V9ZVC2_9STRA|nr:kinase [Thraustotheca clavata]
MTQDTGTLYWTAPEVLKGRHYSIPADIFSFGIVLTELDTVDVPYSDLQMNQKTFQRKVCNNKLRPKLSDSCPFWFVNLVEKCLAHKPSERPTANEIVDILKCQLFPLDQDA